MLALTEEMSFLLGEDIVLQALPELDHYYAFNISSGDHYRLNASAYWILSMLREPKTFREMKDHLRAYYGIPENTAEEDLQAVIEQADSDQLIIRGSGDGEGEEAIREAGD
ncbi:MAG: PqqD family protein [Pseudomonadota bacterium]